MSLVAYDDSGSSEYEDDDQVTPTATLNKLIEVNLKPGPSTKILEHNESGTDVDGSLFNALPKPTHKVSQVIEEEDEFLHKKEAITNIIKPKSKITVPSLSDFKDVANTVPTTKPRTVNDKKSGLLSILPQPKNGSISVTTKSLIPHILTKISGSSNVQKKVSSPPSSKKAKMKINSLQKDFSDDSDNEDDMQNDFFSINRPIDIKDELPLDIEQDMKKMRPESSKKEVRSIESYFKKYTENHEQLEPANSTRNKTEMAYSVAGSANTSEVACEDVILDDEAILKLVGARGKRKMEDIQIVDFNQQEVLAEARQLLLKGLMEDTSKRVSASKKRGNEPSHMQKRKHQITYLAHQAKANEAELQNKWANNRMSKRQTQSKYGF